MIPFDDGSFVIQCKQSSLVIAVSEKTGKIIQETEHDGDNQRWIITEI